MNSKMILKDIPTAGGMQAKFKAGYLMSFIDGKIEWFFDERNAPWKNDELDIIDEQSANDITL